MARALARRRARSVVLVARDAAALDETVARAPVRWRRRPAGSAPTWPTARRSAGPPSRSAEPFGEPDILVNAAGVNIRPPLPELTSDEWDRRMAVNLTAPFLLGQRFGPGMAARGWGRVINVASQQAVRAFGNSGGYGASKGGLASLTRSQAEAWAASGVCCNAIVPGFVADTDDARRWPMTRSRSAALAARTMVGRNGEPADFEGIAVFLASAGQLLHHRPADLRGRRLLGELAVGLSYLRFRCDSGTNPSARPR